MYVLADTYTAEGRLAVSRSERAATRSEKLAQWETARQWFRKSLDAWSTVPNPARLSTSGFAVTMPAKVADELAECDRKIASLGGTSHD